MKMLILAVMGVMLSGGAAVAQGNSPLSPRTAALLEEFGWCVVFEGANAVLEGKLEGDATDQEEGKVQLRLGTQFIQKARVAKTEDEAREILSWYFSAQDEVSEGLSELYDTDFKDQLAELAERLELQETLALAKLQELPLDALKIELSLDKIREMAPRKVSSTQSQSFIDLMETEKFDGFFEAKNASR